MNFEFATAGRIVFGNGTLLQAAPAAAAFGGRALVVTGRSVERARPLLDALKREKVEAVLFPVAGEPTVADVRAAAELARTTRCDSVIGFGGGSVLDLAKAVSALMTNPGDLFDYLEIVGRGLALTERTAPCIAIPTTSGTGSEVTRNSVIASPEHRVKVSMRHVWMIPDLAIVDPECTLSVPPSVTASTGLDALTQLLEAFVSKKANPMTDGLCREGLPLIIRSLRRAVKEGTELKAREDMALASLLSGLALANAGLGAVHGFAGPVGGGFRIPHGMVCAALLPHVMAVNLEALAARAPESPALARLTEFAQMTGGSTAQDGLDWLCNLCRDLQVPPLAASGVTEADFPELIRSTQRAGSMKTNPVELTDADLLRILRLERAV